MNRFYVVKNNQRVFNPEQELVPCDLCGGEYVLRIGKYGAFAGCSNFPKCKSLLKLPDFVIKYIELHGIKIYRWYKKCYKCGKMIPVYSYYLNYDLEWYDDLIFTEFGEVGLGDIKYVDKILSAKIPTIQPCYSYTTDTKYMANTCENCGALQGRNYVVDDPDEILGELWHNRNMEKYLYAILRIDDVSKIARDIRRLYTVDYEED